MVMKKSIFRPFSWKFTIFIWLFCGRYATMGKTGMPDESTEEDSHEQIRTKRKKKGIGRPSCSSGAFGLRLFPAGRL
ncbi:MAG: hypothetical protein HFG27_06645 [Provencibacterium sp.]|nr:hypothetical protein [Provencibacterium sp.]